MTSKGSARFAVKAGFCAAALSVATLAGGAALAPADAMAGQWQVTDARGQGLQRYWLDDAGAPVAGRLVGPSEGDESGYYAYALDDNRILRGKWDSGRGCVYVADNDGKLLGSDFTGQRWVVTNAYDGHLERYWVDGDTKAARSGFFSVPGYGDCFGYGEQGYVARGAFQFGGRKWYADNDGRLTSGWLVTSAFGQGLQRYWMGDTVYGSPHAAATSRLVSPGEGAGYWAYAQDDGRILRGKLDTGRGRVYVADNDGKLLGSDMSKDGWVVTGRYDGGLQRYWVDASDHAARSGFFEVPGYGRCFGLGGQGYVLRGKTSFMGHVLLADNDGKLESKDGWVVTAAYDGHLERYWMENAWKDYKGAKTGLFQVDGSYYYGDPSTGFVARNRRVVVDGVSYDADNDGKLTKNSADAIRARLPITEMYRSVFYHGSKDAAHTRYIVMHDTEGTGSGASVVNWWAGNGNRVAAHFVVNRNGSIVQCVPLDVIAHHAGYGDSGHNRAFGIWEDGRDDMRGTKPIGRWASDYGMNAWSIGIEMVHVHGQGYTQAQLRSVDGLIAYIDAYYGFQPAIIDHNDWRSGNSDCDSTFQGYLRNLQRTRTHDGRPYAG